MHTGVALAPKAVLPGESGREAFEAPRLVSSVLTRSKAQAMQMLLDSPTNANASMVSEKADRIFSFMGS